MLAQRGQVQVEQALPAALQGQREVLHCAVGPQLQHGVGPVGGCSVGAGGAAAVGAGGVSGTGGVAGLDMFWPRGKGAAST